MMEDSNQNKITGEEVVRAARKYLDLPYRTQGRETEGEFAGLDCGGLILCVGYDLGITSLQVIGYSNAPDGETFERHLRDECDEVIPKQSVRLGDILAFDYGKGVQHTAFVSQVEPYLRVIHAKQPKNGIGAKQKRGVIDTRLMPGTEDFNNWVYTFRIKGIIKCE